MKNSVLYIHGKGGCAGESEHYKPLFPDHEVSGLDYQTFTPWETGKEIRDAVEMLHADHESITLIATAFGEDLSWDYLCYVREHPVRWTAPTRILYGRQDSLTAYETVSLFAEAHNAELTVMEDGEHWFHTDEQMRFLDDWIRRGEKKFQI